MRLITIISIPMCLVALVSCNAKKKDKDGPGIVDPTHEPKPGGDAQDLMGSWTGECKAFDTNSERISVKVTKDTITFSDENFSDANCASPWFTKKAVSSYTARNPDEDSGLGTIDLVAVKMSNTPHTQNEVNTLNQEAPCNYNQWKLNIEVDVTALNCTKDERPIDAGDKGYDIYALTNKVKTLQFGFNPFASFEESNRGRSADDRPSEVNAYKYTKN